MINFFLFSDDKQQDKYWNSLFVKRPDEDREKMKVKECSKFL